jgi:hypothetical protein
MSSSRGNHASISIPSPTIARKIGVTEHARQGCSYSEAANLSHHMGHSLKVSHKYCKATVAAKDCISTYERIKSLGKGTQEPKQPHKCCTWSEVQVALLTTHLHAAIEAGLEISLAEARKFLEENPIADSTAKNIQYKVVAIWRKLAKQPPAQ